MATFLPKIKQSDNLTKSVVKDKPVTGGRSYKLGDSKIAHSLPPPSQLKPYVDRIPGEMETWPANSNILSNSQVKPNLLQKLEGYLLRELRILGSSNSSDASEKRLQAFREVFDYFIDDFRTYKPLLSSIKQEYENMLELQKDTIRNLEPLKAMLVNVNDQCEQKVLNLKQDDKKDLALAKKRNADLDDVILTLKEEIISLKQQVKKCQDEVEDVYKKYRDESDSKKLLIQSLNDLKYQQEDSKRESGGENGDVEGNEEDSVFLRIALKKAREDLDKKSIKLSEVLADYGDVVPRRDFEKMEVQFENMKEEFESLKTDYDTLRKEHTSLIDVHKKVVEQRDSFASDCERMRVSATPRPDWNKCGFFIEGGEERWAEVSSGCSTNEKVDILLAEMSGQDIETIRSGVHGAVDFFEPRGITEDVPLYLRSSENVRNRHLSKYDTLLMIKDIWQQKIKDEGKNTFSEHTPMPDYLYKYLKQNFGVENMVVEWGYNLRDALLRYSSDKNISGFYGVLIDDLDEDIYYENLNFLEGLFRLFTTNDTDARGVLQKENFQNCLSSYFTSMSAEEVTNIVNSAESELESSDGSISYSNLFNVDEAGNNGAFINYIRELCRQDKEDYMNELKAYFEKNSTNDVSKQELSEALTKLNPVVNPDLCQKYVSLGFRDHTEEKLDISTIVSNLSRSCIRRF